ncbi:hypothetical protein NE237_002783 [Protea cynaroides]|uniref:Uncharacterized protein n=1 Tax=Protea cynaroides TaxID=273540 RepID=A0A9Q0KG67_9MAGN|nr:hypothetical protein NE237_002783 [Protea cynaroides]
MGNFNAIVIWDRDVFLKPSDGLVGTLFDIRGRINTLPPSLPMSGVNGSKVDQPDMVFATGSDGVAINHLSLVLVRLGSVSSVRVPPKYKVSSHPFPSVRVATGVQGGNHGSAMAMVNGGIQVAPGIPETMASDSGGREMLEEAGRIFRGVAGDSRGNPSLERPLVDLRKFLGFPSLDAGQDKYRNISLDAIDKPGLMTGVNGRNWNGRKRQRWLACEKGKNVVEGGSIVSSGFPGGGEYVTAALVNGGVASIDSVTGVNGALGNGSFAANSGSRAGVNPVNVSNGVAAGGRSFASVLWGLPDLSSLLKPITEGGITRVVIP